VEVTDVLYGRAPSPLIIRVLSEPEVRRPREEPARWTVSIPRDAPAVLLLARDAAAEVGREIYVPCFASVLPVEGDDRGGRLARA
jgi:hypothetical protein